MAEVDRDDRRERLAVLARMDRGWEQERMARVSVWYRDYPELVLEDALTVVAAGADLVDRGMVQGLLAHGLDEWSAGPPSVTLERAGEDAAFWASVASPGELETYLAAICAELADRRRPLPERAIKRLVVALWNRMGAADQRAFLARVAPEARAGRAAG